MWVVEVFMIEAKEWWVFSRHYKEETAKLQYEELIEVGDPSFYRYGKEGTLNG